MRPWFSSLWLQSCSSHRSCDCSVHTRYVYKANSSGPFMAEDFVDPLTDDAPGQGLYIFAYLFSMLALAITMVLYT